MARRQQAYAEAQQLESTPAATALLMPLLLHTLATMPASMRKRRIGGVSGFACGADARDAIGFRHIITLAHGHFSDYQQELAPIRDGQMRKRAILLPNERG